MIAPVAASPSEVRKHSVFRARWFKSLASSELRRGNYEGPCEYVEISDCETGDDDAFLLGERAEWDELPKTVGNFLLAGACGDYSNGADGSAKIFWCRLRFFEGVEGSFINRILEFFLSLTDVRPCMRSFIIRDVFDII